MYGSAGNIEMLSTEEYFTFKGLLQHKDDKEVFALARLTFYENLFIGQVSVVWNRLPRDKEKLTVIT